MPLHLPRPSSLLPTYPTLRIYTLTLLYLATPTLYLLRTHASIYGVTGASMSPLLSPTYATTGTKDLILLQRSLRLADDPVAEGGSGATSQLRRGMVVAFEKPTEARRRLVVKRVVALEGDVVMPARRWRTYDGKGRSAVVDARDGRMGGCVGNGKTGHGLREEQEEITVPFGHVWVEGDNTDDTIDSNDYGPISKSLITGVATRIVWPPARWGVIDWQRDWKRLYGKRVKKVRDGGVVPEEWAM